MIFIISTYTTGPKKNLVNTTVIISDYLRMGLGDWEVLSVSITSSPTEGDFPIEVVGGDLNRLIFDGTVEI